MTGITSTRKENPHTSTIRDNGQIEEGQNQDMIQRQKKNKARKGKKVNKWTNHYTEITSGILREGSSPKYRDHQTKNLPPETERKNHMWRRENRFGGHLVEYLWGGAPK